MSGASDLTSTGIKLDRLPKTLPATSSFKDSFPGWIGRGRLSDSDDETLPEIQDTLTKFKHDGNADAKRSRDLLPDIDTEVSESKRAKTGNGIDEQRQASGVDSSAPSVQNLTGLRRESLSPKHPETRVVDPLPSDPSSPSTIAQTRNEVRQFQRKALFRSPSFDENSEIVAKPEKAETDTEKTETSEVDELEDTTEWMKENVEITDD